MKHCSAAKKVLIVEDNSSLAMTLGVVLDEFRIQAVVLSNADEALTYLMRNGDHISLLLTDIAAPGKLNGAQLAKHVSHMFPTIPVVVMSRQPKPENLQDCRFLGKPFSLDVLIREVQLAIQPC